MRFSTRLGFYRKYWFGISVALIILVALFFRFINYQERWALASDQARDAIVAIEAYKNHEIPALGPFSSAGNFTTGNTWYVWLILSFGIFPFLILTPWIILSLAYTLIVVIMIFIGKDLGGKLMAVILGLLAALSPAQISQSLNLTNPSLVALFAVLTIFFLIKYIKKGGNFFLFLFCFFLSCAVSTHFQSLYMLLLIPIAIFLKRPSIKGLFFILLGLIIPFASYIVHDLTHNFYNTRGFIDYALYGQYKVYVPNRWLTYAGIFWPELIGKIIGGSKYSGYAIMVVVAFAAVFASLKKRFTKPLFCIFLWLLFAFIALRYYRGERFDGYFIFLHGFILVTAAWAFTLIARLNKYVGILLILIFCIGSIKINASEIANSGNYTALQANYWSSLLINKYPNKGFSIYTYGDTSSKSLPLVLYLEQQGKNDPDGLKIGFGSPKAKDRPHHKLIVENTMGYELWNLSGSSSAKLEKAGWGKIGPSEVYSSTTKWFE